MRNVKKTLILGLFMAIIISLAGCGSNSSSRDKDSADKVFKWNVASIYSNPTTVTEFNSLGLSHLKFVELVNERSDGRIVLTGHYDSVLGGNQELFQKVRTGDLEVFYGQPLSSVDEKFGAWNSPYLFADLDQVEKANAAPDGPLFKLSAEWLGEHKVKLLAVGPGAFRGFINSKHPVKKISDLKDLKVRIYQDPAVEVFWKGISNAIELPFNEVYTALETGAIDGLEFQATSVLNRKMDEVAKYYTDIDWQWVSGANVVVSDKHWNELPKDLQEIVQQAAIDAMKYQGELQREDDKKALDELKVRGVEVYNLTPEEREEWIEYARGLNDQLKEAVGEEAFNQVLEIVESSGK